jgi:predicted nucleic acid-binding protein
MKALVDTSVLIAALFQGQAHHEVCARLLEKGGLGLYQHAVPETFSILTGGRLPERVGPAQAVQLVETALGCFDKVITLTPAEMVKALGESERRGVRGGAIYDYLHLVAAKKAEVTRLYTLNIRHFLAFHEASDPAIFHPE